MKVRMQVLKCESCGNMVEVLHGGIGAIACCGQPMQLYVENTRDAAKEKHVPVVQNVAEGIKVSVGSVAHPMDENHFIEWIEVLVGDTVQRHFLRPGQPPEAVFQTTSSGVVVRGYCNLHGLWKA